MYDLQFATPDAWVACVLENFDTFLNDHAAAERKASGMAMSMLMHYTDKPLLMHKLADIALEELQHFKQVLTLMTARGVTPQPDEKDPYIKQIQKLTRTGRDVFLIDRLIIASIVEARGYERFSLIAESIEDEQLKAFYGGIAESEARHYLDFIELAEHYFERKIVYSRLDELLPREAEIVKNLPIRAALH